MKLVRDKIPQIILTNSGKQPKTFVVGGKQFEELLIKKLEEEVSEFKEDLSIEELADVLEVIYAFLDYKGLTFKELNKIRQKKFLERGGFKKKIILK